MSTRSGRRIHGSFHENIGKPESELDVKSEKKTRNRRLKENDAIIVPKSKKRNNYVSYPTEDEHTYNNPQKNSELNDLQTLKEQDLNLSVKPAIEVDNGKVTRQTRRTKKLSESGHEEVALPVVENGKTKKKSKKNKKKKDILQVEVNENENPVHPPGVSKKSKKKKGKILNSFTEEVIVHEVNHLNKSSGSIDSFHSAAGSPIKDKSEVVMGVVKPNGSFTKSPRRASKRMKADCEDVESSCLNEMPDISAKKIKLSNSGRSSEVNNRSLRSKNARDSQKDTTFNKSDNIPETLDGTFEKTLLRSRRSSIKNSTFDKDDTPMKTIKSINSTLDKKNTPTPNKNIKITENNTSRRKYSRLNEISDIQSNTVSLNTTFEKSEHVVLNGTLDRQTILNSTIEKSNDSKQPSLNTTFEKNKNQRQSVLNSTFDKSKESTTSTLNSTFDKKKRCRQSLNTTFENVKSSVQTSFNSTFEKVKESKSQTLNSTFEKSENLKSPTLNSTYDKDVNLNSTFEKNELKSESSKSSLISSDSASNLTSDKSGDNSRISVTSDDSRTENIVNTTPVLIESSIDESQIQDPTPKKIEQGSKLEALPTPLKREGTFTKDGPDVIMSSKAKIATTGTPIKRMSLPSPGSTPFPFSKSAQKEKSMLNVTRSIEKATRRSSLAEPAQRTTRVMFCSPVNNPAVLMQQKKKVIKSSMKGSNKSFVFDESVSEAIRPAPRKRSYTQSDADDARSKRKRLADPLQQSVDRLSRPRTCSATAKLSEPSTPSNKPVTPLKKAATPRTKAEGKAEVKPARTKLPNFAALHQKEFSKMESLDECQRRRARRARLLLTPTGAARLGEKTSPQAQGTTTEAVKPVKAPTKKTDTPRKTPKLPTLMSLRPGYTRFGFKMHLDANPFSVPPKHDPKPRDNKPNGLLTRQPSQPSLAGATTSRKEAAKQTVMREKSFSSLSDRRNVTRKENRSVIKGVRTNRRFELQMKMRNINS